MISFTKIHRNSYKTIIFNENESKLLIYRLDGHTCHCIDNNVTLSITYVRDRYQPTVCRFLQINIISRTKFSRRQHTLENPIKIIIYSLYSFKTF